MSCFAPWPGGLQWLVLPRGSFFLVGLKSSNPWLMAQTCKQSGPPGRSRQADRQAGFRELISAHSVGLFAVLSAFFALFGSCFGVVCFVCCSPRRGFSCGFPVCGVPSCLCVLGCPFGCWLAGLAPFFRRFLAVGGPGLVVGCCCFLRLLVLLSSVLAWFCFALLCTLLHAP